MEVREIKVFVGIDVGKAEHRAAAVTTDGRKVLDEALPNDERLGGHWQWRCPSPWASPWAACPVRRISDLRQASTDQVAAVLMCPQGPTPPGQRPSPTPWTSRRWSWLVPTPPEWCRPTWPASPSPCTPSATTSTQNSRPTLPTAVPWPPVPGARTAAALLAKTPRPDPASRTYHHRKRTQGKPHNQALPALAHRRAPSPPRHNPRQHPLHPTSNNPTPDTPHRSTPLEAQPQEMLPRQLRNSRGPAP